LLLNDHSILVAKNPKKDVLPILKSIMRHGVIWYQGEASTPARPIKVNITVWVYIDILPSLGFLTKGTKKAGSGDKKVKEIITKEYGLEGKDFVNLFEIVIDCT